MDDISIIKEYERVRFGSRKAYVNSYSQILSEHESEVYLINDLGQYAVISRGVQTSKSSISLIEPVRANYGIIRVQQSFFMASHKMSCTQTVSRKYDYNPVAPKGGGGSKGMGELDLSQLEAIGMKSCLEEFSNRADMCVVTICNCCRLLEISCSCKDSDKLKYRSFKAALPLSSIKFILATRVCVKKNIKMCPAFDL